MKPKNYLHASTKNDVIAKNIFLVAWLPRCSKQSDKFAMKNHEWSVDYKYMIL